MFSWMNIYIYISCEFSDEKPQIKKIYYSQVSLWNMPICQQAYGTFTSVFFCVSALVKNVPLLLNHMLFCGSVISLIFQFDKLRCQTGLASFKTFTVTALELIPSPCQWNNTECKMRYNLVIHLALLLHILFETGKL